MGQTMTAAQLAEMEEALRSLGLLYGAKCKLSECAGEGRDEKAVIRTYLERERPHLLESYGIDSLVELVQGALHRGAGHGGGFEQFSPRG